MTTLDGSLLSLYGPVEGRWHDLRLMRQIGWEVSHRGPLINYSENFNLYADSSFMKRSYLIVSCNAATLYNAETQFNSDMSAVIVTLEWSYRDVKQSSSATGVICSLKHQKFFVGRMFNANNLLLKIAMCLFKGGYVEACFDCKTFIHTEYLAYKKSWPS